MKKEERTEEITLGKIEGFLSQMEEKGRGSASLHSYRRKLMELYKYLPEGKLVGEKTGAEWKDYLEKQGYHLATVNNYMSVWNSFFQYLGRRELRMGEFNRETESVQPELSRTEYLRLLSAAKQMGKEKSYLLIKTLGGAGMRIQELPQLTIESVERGVVELEYHNHKQKRVLHLPDGLQRELLDYVRREGRKQGQVFTTPAGTPMTRSTVNYYIGQVSGDAQVAREKANPRCLWKMYQETFKGIWSNVAVLIEQSYQRMLEEEQLTTGWGA